MSENGRTVRHGDQMVCKFGMLIPSASSESKSQETVLLPQNLASDLKNNFKCTLCRSTPMSSPVLATSCCGFILGCQDCVNDYYANYNTHCPSCNNPEGYKKTFRLHGIQEILQALGNGVRGVDSALFAESLQCTMCDSFPVSSAPVISTCCGRVVGCSDCIKRWHQTKDQCPHCRKDDGKNNIVRLRGMERIFKPLKEFFDTIERQSS
ncbi:uncharacterized protein LOC134186964 [Corticium candelabrum]|uniref:uncharacterized protein LOC134186964 n=1 Tax=Corticium candelabrum TaxID=121492 RepID=UPI002E276490|nr:uncharacterized protein LOC134186964 [Corticium candelabrum]